MSLKAIRNALETRLSSFDGAFPFESENAPFTPVEGTPYGEVHLLPAESRSPCFGSNNELVVETGIFQITLIYPINTGTKEIYEKAEALRSHFPKGLPLTSGGVTVQVTKRASVGRAFTDSGWYRLPVSIPYFSNVYE